MTLVYTSLASVCPSTKKLNSLPSNYLTVNEILLIISSLIKISATGCCTKTFNSSFTRGNTVPWLVSSPSATFLGGMGLGSSSSSFYVKI